MKPHQQALEKSAWPLASAKNKRPARLLTLAAMLALALPAGAASYTWNVPGGNWSVPGSWNPTTPGNGPSSTDTVIFGNTDASTVSTTVNNVVDSGFAGTVGGLTYNSAYSSTASSVSPLYNVTQIPVGQTLKVAGPLLVGGLNEGTGAYLTYAYFTGGGTLLATTNFTVQNYGSASGANAAAYLNLSALSTFAYNNAAGTISIGDVNSFTRAGGNLILAATSNLITAAAVNLATSAAAQAGPLCTLVLGAGTNVLNATAINIANNKGSGTVSFPGSGAGLRVRGVSGADTDRATITVGNRNQSGTGTCAGTLALNGNRVDIKASTLTVGNNNSAGTTGDTGTGILQFDTGIVDATTVIIANSVTALGAANGTIMVGTNGTMIVGAGGLSLMSESTNNGVATGVLTISNGTVVCNGNITEGSTIGTGTINFVTGGTLSLPTGGLVGTPSLPINNLNLIEGSTLAFGVPSAVATNIVVNNLTWPTNDSLLTLAIGSLPPNVKVGSVIPLIHFATTTGGTFTAPQLTLPTGVSGTLSEVGNNIVFTVTGGTFVATTPNLITLCTNTTFSCVVTSTVTTITNIQLIVQSTALGGVVTNTTTNTVGSPTVAITGMGTSSVNLTYPLTPNTIYLSVTARAMGANGVTVSSGVNTFDTLVPTLVVEAADYNFSGGQYLNTPANGGLALYVGKQGVAGVDFNKATRTNYLSYYRPSDPVVIQAALPGAGVPPALTEQKFVSAAAGGDTTDVELEVGYNTPGDWLNYSRTFGAGGSAPATNYNVWCYLAVSGTNTQLTFSQVTSDPTQGAQTTNFLGYFGTPAFADNGYNNYEYVPLVDQFGNRVSVTVSNGVQTFKSTVVGNPNIAYYLFVPVAPVLTPVLQNVYPNGSAPYQSSGTLSFTVGPANGAPISTNGIGLVINGQPVTAGLSFTAVGSSWTVTYNIASNELYTAVINVTNTVGLSASTTTSFDTFNINNYQWEAVDYDFSTNDGAGNWLGGQFIDNPVPTADVNITQTGELATNSYFGYPTGLLPSTDGYGAIAQQSIDINFTNIQPAASDYYRADGVGSQPATDYLRPKFVAAQQQFNDPNIGVFELGYFNLGNWVNYTRTYPTNNFNIWGRLAGGAGAFSGTTLSMVTSGVGTSNQTLSVLGTFADPAPAGWQTYHWIQLLDTNGHPVVVHLGGKATLRLTSGNNLNVEFMMLTPAPAVASPFQISATVAGPNILISFPTQLGHNFTVLSAGSLTGAYTAAAGAVPGDGAVHVVTIPLSGAQGFFRVVAQ